MRPPKNTDMTGACSGNYKDFSGNIGIVGTPVIDPAAQTIYFVARSTDGINYVQYLHAVNIINGSEMPGSPVKITATCAGHGWGSINNVIAFNSQTQNQRMGLTLVNGIVYISFSSHCDWGPYHGWILGYNSSTLQQQIVYNNTPEGGAGGIWESGNGLAADNEGNLYCVSGNGTEGANNDPTDLINRGESALKLTPTSSSLKVTSYFTPYNYQALDSFDRDYGSMDCFLIQNSNYFSQEQRMEIYICWIKTIWVVLLPGPTWYSTVSSGHPGLHCQPSYYKGANCEYVYLWSEQDQLRAYPLIAFLIHWISLALLLPQ